jgi:hypothetical protein
MQGWQTVRETFPDSLNEMPLKSNIEDILIVSCYLDLAFFVFVVFID